MQILAKTYLKKEPTRISIKVSQSLPELALIAKDWEALLHRSLVNRAFGSYDWYVQACVLYPDIQPYVLMAYRDEKLVGLLPLVIHTHSQKAIFASRLSDYNDLICEEGDVETAVSLIESALSKTHPFRDLAMIRIRRDSNCMLAFRSLGKAKELEPFFVGMSTCPYLQFPTADPYPESKSLRRNLRWSKNATKRAGIFFTELDPSTIAAEQLIEQFLLLHQVRFGEDTPLVETTNKAFIQQLFPLLLEQKKIRLFALQEGNQIQGIQLYMVGAKALCYWNGGWQEAVRRYSPGNLLIDRVVELAKTEGFEEVDFLRGEEAYKMNWANGVRGLGNLEL